MQPCKPAHRTLWRTRAGGAPLQGKVKQGAIIRKLNITMRAWGVESMYFNHMTCWHRNSKPLTIFIITTHALVKLLRMIIQIVFFHNRIFELLFLNLLRASFYHTPARHLPSGQRSSSSSFNRLYLPPLSGLPCPFPPSAICNWSGSTFMECSRSLWESLGVFVFLGCS